MRYVVGIAVVCCIGLIAPPVAGDHNFGHHAERFVQDNAEAVPLIPDRRPSAPGSIDICTKPGASIVCENLPYCPEEPDSTRMDGLDLFLDLSLGWSADPEYLAAAVFGGTTWVIPYGGIAFEENSGSCSLLTVSG